MNDQQKYLRGELDWIIRQIQVDGCNFKPYIAAVVSLDEMVSEEQEKDSIPFDWLFEFRAEIAQVKDFMGV
jgi:hypothetical protein